ncbi:HpcH/HpaI aldolase/citrate lyase family protein [Klenkia sp. PcliD-1-E]|uniref:HpcH/HpaI aldolase/citrate lyase family protein n=1 Tax=Klenkia sp. PcliD-1-E TaxID=2954492 RepID=UPI0020982521|nr:HpcH/HpaI aldolase/citrate lyase family protein [Klenkia sp. PcliD-1-E]MCO7219374.1 HpcH/HpaI aldolase/citrate lyase family protein [Klenkia sp. PcliD-1-E]
MTALEDAVRPAALRHFAHVDDDEVQRLFLHPPQPVGRDDDTDVVALALGATLYLPAHRPALSSDVVRQRAAGVSSVVLCLEDAVADDDLPAAEANLVRHLRALADDGAEIPFVFVRVRHPAQVGKLVHDLAEAAGVLTGFVLPKFTGRTGPAFLDAVRQASVYLGRRLRVMPVIESPEVAHAETRAATLADVAALVAEHRDDVLAVRIGATDLSAAFGLRRRREVTVYDVRVVADVIADVVNVLGRSNGTGSVITGPVWEYFRGNPDRVFKPQLRETPFRVHDERPLRSDLLAHDLDGLIREVVLDQANGLAGKTVIHPSHVAAVHALSVVTHEEHADALDVLGAGAGGGASASTYRNKMNESKPHRAWAQRTVQRAHVFGVARPTTSFVDLLGAGTPR